MAPTDFFGRIRSYYHKEPGTSTLVQVYGDTRVVRTERCDKLGAH